MTPVSIAEYPITDCRNSGRMNNNPNSPRLTIRATALPLAKVRMRNSAMSIITTLPALRRRASTSTKRTSRITERMSANPGAERLSSGHVNPPALNSFLGVIQP